MFKDSDHDTKRHAKTVLVLGEDTRSFLSVVRSLGRAGYMVDVVCYDRQSPAVRSKYISKCFFYNYQAYTQAQWLEKVLHLIELYQYDLVMPCDERSIYPLWQSRHQIPHSTQLAISNETSLDVLFDKWKTKQAAFVCDIAVADGKLVRLKDCSYCELAKKFGPSFVIKPLQSFESTSLNQRNKVVIVKSEQDFIHSQKSLPHHESCLVEAFFSGKGEAIAVFSIQGEVHSAFAYRRLAEPESGGGSSYRKSIPLDEELLKATKRLCQHTDLTGVAMFEFRRNEMTKEWILIEVNARFWGGLPLAIAAGVDFPKIYADYLCFGHKPKSGYQYRDGHVARVLTQDIYEIRREVDRLSQQQGNWVANKHLVARLVSFFNVFSSTGHIDSLAKDDIQPFFYELGDISAAMMIYVTKRSRLLTALRRSRERARLKKLFKTNAKRRLLFICYGNIMRSPFAEHCFANDDRPQLESDSFGFHKNENRQSPDEAIHAAEMLQYDLVSHRSKCLSQDDLQPSDIVIYFDEKNRHTVQSNYRVYHLFCAADLLDSTYPKEIEITDPYGENAASIKQCYERIANSMSTLVDVYREAKG